MSEFSDQYVQHALKGFSELGDKLFPPEADRAFHNAAMSEIAAGKNVCLICGKATMEKAWPFWAAPAGVWLCPEHGQKLWKAPNGPKLILNMEATESERQAWLDDNEARMKASKAREG